MKKAETYVYVDGFNLYYGALKNTPYKWLNLKLLFENLLTQNNVKKIRYFTARVSPRYSDDQIPRRQWEYIKALKTVKNLEIHEGYYLQSITAMPRANRKPNEPKMVKVLKSEEKGSDVNIASYILLDDCAVVVSNDSDLFTPMKIVKEEFGKTIGVINPHKKQSQKLKKVTDFYKPIREGVLQASQFPPIIQANNKTIMKPESW